ncbi:MAG: hypothetical protein M3Z17_01460 [Gemmatimonadota bacterium]|nr:hypothetical protein [Gemmatimonadota bacterium]
MFIELVELLRCIRAHDESWLVASIGEMRDRSIRTGILGCPVCSAEYPIADGIVDFTGGASPRPASALNISGEELALRAGGFLNLGGGGGVVVLGGSWAAASRDLTERVDVRVIAVNAPGDVQESAAVGLVRAADVIPLASGSCAGVALDSSFSAAAVAAAERVVRAGGRIVGAAEVERPAGLTLLAEDESWWVAEKPPAITTLRRGNR